MKRNLGKYFTIFLCFFPVFIVPAQSFVVYNPVIEHISLIQNGSLASPYKANTTKTFTVISRILFTAVWNETNIDYSKFLSNTALTNGINIKYDSISLLDNQNITKISDFAEPAFDLSIFTDDRSPKGRMLVSRYSFNKFIDNTQQGLLLGSLHTLSFWIQDDITALSNIDELSVMVEGYVESISSHFSYKDNSFYPNIINEITLEYLELNASYNLFFNTTLATDGSFWLNVTARERTMTIFYDLNTDELTTQITIYLYRGNTYIETYRALVISNNNIDLLSQLINIYLPYVAFGFIVLTIVSLIFTDNKKRRM